MIKVKLKLELQTALRKLQSIELTASQRDANNLLDYDHCISVLSKIKIDFKMPDDREADYVEALEMLEMSVDDTINLDSESFKAYIKNEWPWISAFNNMLVANKTYISGAL